jgi:hypothetical protein
VGIVSKSWQWESRSREVRHPDRDESRGGYRSECKIGGGDRRSRELDTRKLKVYRLEGSSREVRDSGSVIGEYRSLVTSGLEKRRNQC